jgi:hypothetical protein
VAPGPRSPQSTSPPPARSLVNHGGSRSGFTSSMAAGTSAACRGWYRNLESNPRFTLQRGYLSRAKNSTRSRNFFGDVFASCENDGMGAVGLRSAAEIEAGPRARADVCKRRPWAVVATVANQVAGCAAGLFDDGFTRHEGCLLRRRQARRRLDGHRVRSVRSLDGLDTRRRCRRGCRRRDCLGRGDRSR